MAAEIKLSDGTVLRTEPDVNFREIARNLAQHGFGEIKTSDGAMCLVSREHVVYLRHAEEAEAATWRAA